MDSGQQSMQEKAAVIISPNYGQYARTYLPDCIASLRVQDWAGEKRIFIVDNGSTPESFSLLEETAPEAEIIRNRDNDGFARGNNQAMRQALERRFDYIILFNMDTIVAPDCISRLVAAARLGSTIGAVQARLMLWPESGRINSLGNVTHFLGFGYCDGYGELWSDDPSGVPRDIAYPSGAAVLFKREVLEAVGLFDEAFWMYNEDQDLGWRIWLAGWKCVLAPKAVVYHKYDASRIAQKYYWMDRNRILSMLKNYQWSTLVLIAAAFWVMELGLLLFAAQRDLLGEKIKVYRYFLNPETRSYILSARRESQALRRVADRDLLELFSGRIWYEEIGSWQLRLGNLILDSYWRIVKFLIRHAGGRLEGSSPHIQEGTDAR